jgi:glycosyltransferase involved in cell wall biosynthesis
MKNKKILLIGPYPPPYGGVSVHIKRLKMMLSDRFDIDMVDESREKKINIFNLRSLNIFRYLHKVFKADVVHIHSGKFLFRMLHFSTASLFFKKKVITIHGYEPGRGARIRPMDRMILNNCSKVIFVSSELAEAFKVKQYIIKEAFLPPDVNEEAEIPAEVKNWGERKKSQGYLICVANAWRLDRHENEDLYGLDLCIMAAKRNKENGIKTAFIFVVSDNSGVIKIDQYKKMIMDFDLEDSFLIWEAPLSFSKLILKADIVLRPTNTDGDALTVREGLFLGKSVIASDVVIRPKDTKLFKTRDADSLAQVIGDIIRNGQNNPIVATDVASNLKLYITYYSNNVYN